MRWQAVVFDLDDTLYPEREYVFSGFKSVSAHLSKIQSIKSEIIYSELLGLFNDGIRKTTFNQWAKSRNIDEDIVSLCVEIYRNHRPIISPYSDVSPILNYLKNQDYKLGLISDGYLAVQKAKWEALGIQNYFDVVTFSDQWGKNYWKPNAKPFSQTQKNLGVTSIVYIGDNPTKDFIGARQCGWSSIRIQRDEGEYKNLYPLSSDYAPDLSISTLDELKTILEYD